MFGGDSADMCAKKIPLVSMGGRAEGLACADPGARTPIGTSGNFSTDSHVPVIISGVEPELTEEINAAYADMLEELGAGYYK